MKKIFFIKIILFFLMLNINTGFSEENKYDHEVEFGSAKGERILQINGNGRVNIIGYNGDKVLLSSNVNISEEEDEEVNEKAKGLRKIGGGGFNIINNKQKNTIIISRPIHEQVNLDVKVPNDITLKFGNETLNQISGEVLREGGLGQNDITILNSLLNGKEIPEEALRKGGFGPNEIEILKNQLGEKEKELRNLKEELPEKSDKNVMGIQIPQRLISAFINISNGIFAGDISIKNFSGIVEVSIEKGNITVENIDGQITASTVQGDINTTFRKLNKNRPLYFSTVNGDIDITFPKNTNADIMSRTVQGDVYTGFDGDVILGNEVNDEGATTRSLPFLQNIFQSNYITTRINGGGQKIYLSTINGNVYIRKGN